MLFDNLGETPIFLPVVNPVRVWIEDSIEDCLAEQ
jgi:hypothetical protein